MEGKCPSPRRMCNTVLDAKENCHGQHQSHSMHSKLHCHRSCFVCIISSASWKSRHISWCPHSHKRTPVLPVGRIPCICALNRTRSSVCAIRRGDNLSKIFGVFTTNHARATRISDYSSSLIISQNELFKKCIGLDIESKRVFMETDGRKYLRTAFGFWAATRCPAPTTRAYVTLRS